MKLLALNLPQNPAEKAIRLERQLIGLELRELVVSPQGLQETKSARITLEKILGDELGTVLQQGLSSLDRETLRKILIHPDCLLDL